MPDPPAELVVRHRQRGHERGRKPDEPDGDGEIEDASRKEEGTHGAQRHEPERQHSDGE